MDRSILRGLYDIHVHAGPSVAKHEIDAGDMLLAAQEAGYAGFLVKDHYFPSMMGAQMVEKHIGDGSCRVMGSIALNNSVGLFNLKALDTARQMGAYIVYFPTVSTKKHIDDHSKVKFVGAGSGTVSEIPRVYIDRHGELVPEAMAVLRYMAQYDMVLGTGHGCLREVDALVRTAAALGVKRILVNHPHYNVGASIEDMKKWAALGAYIEVNACVFKGGSRLGSVEDAIAGQIIRECGAERVILDSDLGQKGNDHPIEGMFRFLTMLHDKLGITEHEIEIMGKVNPGKLLKLEDEPQQSL